MPPLRWAAHWPKTHFKVKMRIVGSRRSGRTRNEFDPCGGNMPSAEGRINVFNGVSAAVSFSSMGDEYAAVVGFMIAYDLLAMLPS
jgi:hypothetical protein